MMRKSAKGAWGMALALGVAVVAVAWNPPMVLFILAAIAAGVLWNAVAAWKGRCA